MDCYSFAVSDAKQASGRRSGCGSNKIDAKDGVKIDGAIASRVMRQPKARPTATEPGAVATAFKQGRIQGRN